MNIKDMSLDELLLHSHKHFLADRITNSDYELEILSRFSALDSALTEAVNLNTKWCKEIATLTAKVQESEQALLSAINSLEASGLCFDHPTIVELRRAIK